MTLSPPLQPLSVRHDDTSVAADIAASPRSSDDAAHGGAAAGDSLGPVVDCDFCIVGADLAGLLIACDLASRGYEVALITIPGEETSGFDAAFAPGFSLPTPELVARVGRDDARALLKMSVAAAEKGMAYVRQAGLAAGPRGRLAVAAPHAAEALVMEHAAREDLLAHSALLLNAQDTQALLGTRAFCAAMGVVPANRVDVAALRALLFTAARESEVHILEGTAGLKADLANPRKCVDAGKVRVRSFGVVFSGGLAVAHVAPALVPSLVARPHVRGVFQVGEDEDAYQGLVEEYGSTGLRFYREGRLLHVCAETALLPRTEGWAAFALKRHARVLGAAVEGQAPQNVHSIMLAGARERMPVLYEGGKGVWYCATLGDDEPTHGVMAADLIVDAMIGQDDRIRLLQPFGLASATQRPLSRMETIVSYGYARLSRAFSGRKPETPTPPPALPAPSSGADGDGGGADPRA